MITMFVSHISLGLCEFKKGTRGQTSGKDYRLHPMLMHILLCIKIALQSYIFAEALHKSTLNYLNQKTV